jgi:hypothetical protein
MSNNKKIIKVGFWNMLAVGLSDDGFVTEDPESIDWAIRGPKILAVLNRMFDEGYDVISVVENDMFLNILEGLQKEGRPIYGEIQRVRNKKNVNNSYTQWFKQGYDKKTNTRSFRDFIKNESDCEEFVQLMNDDKTSDGAPDVSVSDPYLADHGNSVYWNPAKVYAAGTPFPEFNEENYLLTRDFRCYIGRGDNGYIRTFVKKDDGEVTEFNVLTAHLKSGEGEKEEQERVDTLTPLLNELAKRVNPVVLMDSNSSTHYRKAIDIPINVAKVIEDSGFVDAIDTPGNRAQCVKMRGDTAQKQKAGELMCDTIDVILTKRGTNIQVIPVGGVQLYNPVNKTIMTKLRTDAEDRLRVSKWVMNAEYKCDANGNYVGSECEQELRPTGFPLVPIQNKEKTVTLKMMSSNKKSRWGADAKTNVYTGFAKYLRTDESDGGFLWRLYNKLWGGEPELTDEVLESAFRGLYPNNNMPSDHPPFGAIIELS